MKPDEFYVVAYSPDPDEEGPDNEEVIELCNPGEKITSEEALRRADSLDLASNVYGFDVFQRVNIRYDFGWEWDRRVVYRRKP